MDRSYVLGHSARELDRLDLQGVLYRDITRRALLDGGLQSGMRVLDIGCGSGDVARIAAQIVGPCGSVLGVDRDPAQPDLLPPAFLQEASPFLGRNPNFAGSVTDSDLRAPQAVDYREVAFAGFLYREM